MLAFAEQIQVDVGQDRRKPIGILQLDLVVAEPGAQPIMRVARGDRPANSPASWMRGKLADLAGVVDDLDLRASGRNTRTTRASPS